MLRTLPFLLAVVAQTTSGTLGPGDETLNSGEYLDEVEITVPAGQTLPATLTSSDFDGSLAVVPGDDQHDCDEGSTGACLEVPGVGTYQVRVTTFESGETGAYRPTRALTGSMLRRRRPSRDAGLGQIRRWLGRALRHPLSLRPLGPVARNPPRPAS